MMALAVEVPADLGKLKLFIIVLVILVIAAILGKK